MCWPLNLAWNVPDISTDGISITYLVHTADIYNRKNQYIDLEAGEEAALLCSSVINPSSLKQWQTSNKKN